MTNCADGDGPSALIQATNGNFYGTAYSDGESVCLPYSGGGRFFEMTPAGKLTVLHDFCQPNGFYPNGNIVQASNRNFYGTTEAGGAGTNTGVGTFYEITPTGKFTSLYNFCQQSGCPDGSSPNGVILGPDGNFYGSAYGGGANFGTLFEFTPAGLLTTLHSFDSGDGSGPLGTLVLASNGLFYGTTIGGGSKGYGTVFSLSNGFAAFVEALPNAGKVGAKITILGMSLTGTTAVSFNGTAATFTATNSKITATVPAGATTGPITVTTPGGTLNTRTNFRVMPQLLSFSPSSGAAGTSVTITGVSLTQTSKVTFNGKSASFTVNSDSQVTATVPTGATTGRITITTPGGSATSTTSFTVN